MFWGYLKIIKTRFKCCYLTVSKDISPRTKCRMEQILSWSDHPCAFILLPQNTIHDTFLGH